MTTHAIGSFSVKMTPQPWHSDSGSDSSADHTFARFVLDKQYHGDLEAASQGQMLSAGTSEKTSAGYVALEKVTGSLHGRSGSFVLQHNGTMNRGTPQLTITIVPDSGTDELTGLCGALTITIAEGKHSYDISYTLATLQ
jgi:hypothetical protein